MQLRFANQFIVIITTIALFATSCKKDFSKDEPFSDVFTPTIFISSQNQFVYALDPQTGKKKWEYQAEANVVAAPLIMGEYLFVTSQNGFIHKLDAKRGILVKKYNFSGLTISTPYGEKLGKDGNDYLYFGCSDTLFAYDVTADTLEWKFYNTNLLVTSSPTLFDTLVIFGSTDGKVYSLDKDDGVKVWERNTFGPVSSSPTVVGVPQDATGFVYVGSQSGWMYSLRVNDGSVIWQYPTGGAILSSPVAYGGNCIFGSNDYNLYCIDTASGLPRWIIPTNERVVSSPYAHNQILYVGSYDYSLYAVNIIDGKTKWQFRTGALVKSSPLIYDNKLYFGSYDKFLYCLNPEDGKQLWRQNINGLIESSPTVDNLDGKSTNTSSISGNSIN